MFEIEKRSLFTSKKEFENFEKLIIDQAKFIAKYVYKSFLFNDPEYIRIRIILGKDKVEITKKEGNYNTPTRKEINEYINLEKLPEFIKKIESQGFKKCVCVKTESHTYKIDNIIVALNTISDLGMIVEVETLTDKESENKPYLDQIYIYLPLLVLFEMMLCIGFFLKHSNQYIFLLIVFYILQ